MPYYDFVLVRGKHKDFIPKRLSKAAHSKGLELEVVEEAGMWRLYRVDGPD